MLCTVITISVEPWRLGTKFEHAATKEEEGLNMNQQLTFQPFPAILP